jgi:hypothetical protein
MRADWSALGGAVSERGRGEWKAPDDDAGLGLVTCEALP